MVRDISQVLDETTGLGRTTLGELEQVEQTVQTLNETMISAEQDEAQSFQRSRELENRVAALTVGAPVTVPRRS